MYEFTLTGTFVVVALYLLMYRRFALSWLSPVVTSFVLAVLMVDVLVLYNRSSRCATRCSRPGW